MSTALAAVVLEDGRVEDGLVGGAAGRRGHLADDDELAGGQLLHEPAGDDSGAAAFRRVSACGRGRGAAADRRSQALHGSDHGLDVRRRGAAAAANQGGAGLDVAAGVAGEVGGVGGVLEAAVDEGGRAGVGLGGQRQRRVARELGEDFEQALGTVGAVGAERGDVEAFDATRHLGGRLAGEGAAVFHEGHLGDDGQRGRDIVGGVYGFD